MAYGNNPASREYEQTKLRSHFLECLSKEQIVQFPSKPIKPGKPKSEYIFAHVVCQLKLTHTCPSVPYARSGIKVNIFLMQYLEIQIVTGNALCVPKDGLNRQGYTYMYNSWVSVLHVFTVNFMPFIKNKIYLQFTNCAT